MRRRPSSSSRPAYPLRRHTLRPQLEPVEPRLLLANFLVTTTSDTHVAGFVTLREAITAANATPGPNTISFSFPNVNTPGVINYDPAAENWRIQPTSALPTITNQLFIDGYTQNVFAPGTPTNESQSVGITGSPTGGSFQLTFEGKTTAPIPFDASTALVQAALENLSTIGVGNVVVNAGPLPDSPVSITFQKALGDTNVPQVVADGSGLTGGTAPTATAVTTTDGVAASIVSAQSNLTTPVGSNAHVRVILDGSLSGGATGLTITAAHSRVRGLIIDGFSTGIHILGPTAVGNLIQGNYIGQYLVWPNPALGLATSFLAGTGNSGAGIVIDAPSNNTIGGDAQETHNIIAGNGLQGVHIMPGAEGNQVIGNLIGVLEQDTTLYYIDGNAAEGILVESSSNHLGDDSKGGTNVISSNGSQGIHITGVQATLNAVKSNFIGTDINGTFKFGQGNPGNGSDGILIENAPNNIIGGPTFNASEPLPAGYPPGNVIAGNFGAGVRVTGATATGTLFQGNFIGTDLNALSVIPNAQEGIVLLSGNNTVGGTAGHEGNLISGNLRGILISGPSASKNIVVGNLIGTDELLNGDVKQKVRFGNAQEGIRVDNAADNTIGGTSAGARNVISGNNVGVLVIGAAATRNLIAGNSIGTETTGTLDLGNSLEGVRIDGAPGNTIGGVNGVAGNLIVYNHWGVTFSGPGASANLMSGNRVFHNEVDGVLFTAGAVSNLVGDKSDPTRGNLIGYNTVDGVRVDGASTVGDSILTNQILQNGNLPIELVGPSEASDPGDSDVGPNNLQDAPTLTAVATSAQGEVISGSLHSDPFRTYTIQFFVDAPSDPVNDGVYLGMTTVTTDGAANAQFSAPVPGSIPQGEAVKATATSPTGDTSEFSPSISEQIATVQFSQAAVNVSEGAGFATLTVTRSGGSGGQFRVNFATQDGSAVAGVNYQAVTGTLTFAAGVNSQTINIPIIHDGRPDPNLTFQVILSNPNGPAQLGSPAAEAVTVQDIDQPGAIQFATDSFVVGEADGFATITVTRNGGGGAVTVNYTTQDATAHAGVDYAATAGTLTFNPGQTTATFTVPVVDDFVIDGNKTVNLVLSNPTGGATLGAVSHAILTITLDPRDRIPPRVEGVRLITSPRGVTGLVVTFTKVMNPASAQDLLNYGYAVRTAGRDHKFGTPDDLLVGIISAVYDPLTRSVTLTFGKPMHPPVPFELSLDEATNVPGSGKGITDAAGNLLDGDGDGLPGGVYRAVLSGRAGGIIASPPSHPAHPAHRIPPPSGPIAHRARHRRA
jgi:hypothetical protein